MKNVLHLAACIIAMLLVLTEPTAAQSCGAIYQYSDMWADTGGNLVAENYTDGDSSCGDYSAYATVSIALPSGSSYYASGSAVTTFAEVLAQAAAGGENGDGSFDVFSEVDYTCGESLLVTGTNPTHFGESITCHGFVGYDGVACNYKILAYCSARCMAQDAHYITENGCRRYAAAYETWFRWGSSPVHHWCTGVHTVVQMDEPVPCGDTP